MNWALQVGACVCITGAFTPCLDCNAFATHWSGINKFLPIKCELLHSTASSRCSRRSAKWHRASVSERREPISFCFCWHQCGFCLWQLQGNGTWNSDMRCSLIPGTRSWGSCIRHAKIIPTLSLWSDGLDLVRQHGFNHTILSTEEHQYEKVVLLWSWLLKTASNSPCMRDVKCYETRCNAAKSINFQLSHTPQSATILFSM